MGQGEKSAPAPDHTLRHEERGSDEGLLPSLENGVKGGLELGNTRERTDCYKTCTRVHVLAAVIAALFILTLTLIVFITDLGRKNSDYRRLLNDVKDNEGPRTNIPLHRPCPEMWIWYLGKCYNFSNEEGDWGSCNDTCASWDSTLAVIETNTELDFLEKHKGTHEYWIGLKEGPDGVWSWVDGTHFKNWFTIKGDSACAFLNGNKVSSSRCHTVQRCLCSTRDAFANS